MPSDLVTSLSADREAQIAANLNLYLFQEVWNETYRALRNNIRPIRYKRRAVTGSISVEDENILLPTTKDPYYVFVLKREVIPALTWPKVISQGWIPSDTLCNQYQILLDCYHVHGTMMHKKHVYVCKHVPSDSYLVAVNKIMYSKILEPVDADGIRFTIYFDYDLVNNIEVYSYDIPPWDSNLAERYAVYKKYKECQQTVVEDRSPAVIFFLNGIETQATGAANMPLDCHVDIIFDKNVALDFIYDLTDPNLNVGYFSEMDSLDKTIVHIPKKYNPDNWMITHNAIELYIRKKNPEPDGTYKGLYLHRCADRSVGQITHQDISIPNYILDAYRDYLDSTEITLRVMWRQHKDINDLIRDKNYIDILYQMNSDQAIIQYLGGIHLWSSAFTFWTASHLEQSFFIKTIFDVPDIVTIENMALYIEALGYYNTMFLLSKHVHRATVTEHFGGGYLFAKPIVYRGYPCAAIAYADGIHIPNHEIGVSQISDTHVAVTWPERVNVVGVQLAVELHRDGIKDIYRVEPTSGNAEIEIPLTDIDLIEEVDCLRENTKYGVTTRRGFKIIEQYAGKIAKTITASGKLRLTFGSACYGKKYYIQARPRTYVWHSSLNSEIDIQKKMEQGDALMFPLTKMVKYHLVDGNIDFTQDQDRIPIWDVDSILVFLNDRYLVRNIDFTVQTVMNESVDYEEVVATQVVVIQNYNYLRPSNNTLEIYSTSGDDESIEYGHVAPRVSILEEDTTPKISAVIHDNKTVLYSQDCSMIHVNGYFTQAYVQANYIVQADTWKVRDWVTGNPIEVRTTIPYFLSDYMKRHHVNDDTERIDTINKYYFERVLVRLPIEVLDTPHEVYSVYICKILHDILDGSLVLSFDPDASRMISQLGDYKYLEDIDLIMQKKIDLTYVDIYIHYLHLTVQDVEQYRLCTALLKVITPPDIISHKYEQDLEHP